MSDWLIVQDSELVSGWVIDYNKWMFGGELASEWVLILVNIGGQMN